MDFLLLVQTIRNLRSLMRYVPHEQEKNNSPIFRFKTKNRCT